MPSLGDIARHIHGTVVGNANFMVEHLKVPSEAGPYDLCIGIEAKKMVDVLSSRAGALVCAKGCGDDRPHIEVAEPRSVLPGLCALFNPYKAPALPGVHPSAVVSATAQLASGVSIGPLAVVGERARIGSGACIGASAVIGSDALIGSDSIIYPRVVLYDGVKVGSRVILHAGAVIGSDGFGNYRGKDKRWVKIPQIGGCIIGDDVEIGSNTTVDRGAIGSTQIGAGTKIDNLCQVAHNVVIGKDCAIASAVAIAGSAVIGDRVMVGGQAGIVGHVTIGSDVVVMAESGVTTSIDAGMVVSGFPARHHRDELKFQAKLRKLSQS